MTELTETFWVAFVGTIIGFLGLSLKMALKSKCDSIECLCLKIHRNIEAELDEEKYEIEHQLSNETKM
jgi:hypothetical protein